MERISFAMTRKREGFKESHVQHDFFGRDHVHDWKGAGAIASGWRWLPSTSLDWWKFDWLLGEEFFGEGWGERRQYRPLCEAYQESPEFRASIQAHLRDGSLTKADVIAMMAEQSKPK